MTNLTNTAKTKEIRVSRIATIIIFLALIRSIIEIWRLPSTSPQLLPIIVASLITAISCLLMTILGYYAKYVAITATAIVTLVIMLVIKFGFM